MTEFTLSQQNAVVLAHHWLVGMRGGEKVLEELCRIFPDAPIYTLVVRRDRLSSLLRERRIFPSPLQWFPGATRHYKKMLPLIAPAIALMKVPRRTKLVISSDASLIKGLSVPRQAVHICYCHSPPRYIWDMSEVYMQQTAGLGGFGKWTFRKAIEPLRRFDRAAAERVTRFIANSTFVQERISRFYKRKAEVIFPPVNVDSFSPTRPRDDFYLLVSELVPYKRVDLAVRAFADVNRRLVIIGDGSERAALEKLATPNVQFLGHKSFTVLKEHYETCRAFLCPQVEDFGITVVEAQAAGAPVIAFNQGGVLDSVRPNETGLFFDQQTPIALAEAVRDFEERLDEWDAKLCRQNAERFRPERFRRALCDLLMTEGFL
jgi:glycosyltransferase involved in cell wall biosynthesis